MKQQSLFIEKVKLEFGGSLNKGKRKGARPLNLKAPIHLVLKAEDSLQLFRNTDFIKSQTEKLSAKFGVKVYSIAIHEDHIHGVFSFPNRIIYRGWIRSLTGVLSRKVAGLKWRLRPYTRILTWGKQYKSVLGYLKFNHDEAEFIREAWERVEHFENSLASQFSDYYKCDGTFNAASNCIRTQL